jgi:hypothetical protein
MRSLFSILLLLALFFVYTGCKPLIVILKGNGAPPKKERELIEARGDSMLTGLKAAALYIYPVTVPSQMNKFHVQYSIKIAEALKNAGFTNITILKDEPREIPYTPQSNQAAMFWERAMGFSKYVKNHPGKPDGFMVMVDVLGTPGKWIGGVHLYTANTSGDLAHIIFWNSHWELFKEFNPKDLDDVSKMISTYLIRSAKPAR